MVNGRNLFRVGLLFLGTSYLPLSGAESPDVPIVLHFDSGKAEGKFGKAIFLSKGKDKDCKRFEVHALARKNISRLTVEMWVKSALREAPKRNCELLVGWWGGPIMFLIDPSRRLSLLISGAMMLEPMVPASQITAKSISFSSTKQVPDSWWNDGRWHHVAFQWDTGEGVVRTFFDGEMMGENKGTPFEIINVPRGYVLGPIGDEDACLFVDEFRASFRLLDAAEIRKNFEATVPFRD